MRLPWNRKQEDVKNIEPPRNPISYDWINMWNQIKILYPIGYEFRLLEHDIIVNKYINISHIEEVPALVCLYFDNSGSMRQLIFENSDWECLIRSYKTK